jgi:hypothetical protein
MNDDGAIRRHSQGKDHQRFTNCIGTGEYFMTGMVIAILLMVNIVETVVKKSQTNAKERNEYQPLQPMIPLEDAFFIMSFSSKFLIPKNFHK